MAPIDWNGGVIRENCRNLYTTEEWDAIYL